MTDLPFIPLPKSETFDRPSKKPPLPNVNVPGRARQRGRLAGRFARLSAGLATPAGMAELRSDPGSIAVERAVVFELIDLDVRKAYGALALLGFELLDEDDEERPNDAGFTLKPTKSGRERPDAPILHRLYFAMPSEAALRSLLDMWRRYEREEAFPHGFTAWRDLFEHLSDIRPWGPADRLSPETAVAFEADLAAFPDDPRRLEIELWWRQGDDARATASDAVRHQLRDMGGSVVDERQIPDILYHAMLVDLPAGSMRALLADRQSGLAAVDPIMLLLPQTLAVVAAADEPVGGRAPHDGLPPAETRAPRIALFDGMPLAGHKALTGRLDIDDPLGLERHYAAEQRRHGTRMASIILLGDANAPTPVPHRLHVRPVLVPASVGESEHFPGDTLAVWVMHQAFHRLLSGADGQPPTAPEVRIVNLSLGEPHRRFAGMASPWARLLDRVAFDHKLLIVVSAGNVPDPLPLRDVATVTALEDMAPEERARRILAALLAERTRRTLLSPAEAINVLTVGARHNDNLFNGAKGAGAIDPYHLDGLPNVTSALGHGAARAGKPDILMNGGRELVRATAGKGHVEIAPVRAAGGFFGIKAATAVRAGGTEAYCNEFGTSPAAALATHEAARLEAAIETMDGLAVPPDRLAVVLKALLAHAAAWDGEAADIVGELVEADGASHWQRRRLEQARLLGLGTTDVARVLAATEQRAVLLAHGTIERDRIDRHDLPLPQGLSGRREWRALTATLVWLTPVNFRHRGYRAAALDLAIGGLARGTNIGAAAEENLAARGTICHRRWSGDDPAIFDPDQGLHLDVVCMSPTGVLEIPVPYALAVTLEVGIASTIDVHAGIRARIGQRVVAKA